MDISSLLYCKKYNYDIEFHGFDTFGGFHGDVVSNSNDEPTQFIDLFENGTLTKNILIKQRRTNNFKGLNHLSEKYFSDAEKDVLTFESYFSNLFVKYYQGTFSETTKNFNKENRHITFRLWFIPKLFRCFK